MRTAEGTVSDSLVLSLFFSGVMRHSFLHMLELQTFDNWPVF